MDNPDCSCKLTRVSVALQGCCWLLFHIFKGWIYHHISFSYEVAQGYHKAQFYLIHSALLPTDDNGHIGLVNGEGKWPESPRIIVLCR